MAKQIINTGTFPNDGSGDPLRTAFTKVNQNFDELNILTTVSANGGSLISPTPLDLTKFVHKLSGNVYSLSDGTEGQIMYLVPQSGCNLASVSILVNNARLNNLGNVSIFSDVTLVPFSEFSSVNFNTLLYVDNAWETSRGLWILSGSGEEPVTIIVISQPESIIVNNGDPASFSVLAVPSGTSTLSYQWEYSTDSGNTWSGIVGDGSSLTVESVYPEYVDNNQFRVVISGTNGAQTVTSVAATLTILP